MGSIRKYRSPKVWPRTCEFLLRSFCRGQSWKLRIAWVFILMENFTQNKDIIITCLHLIQLISFASPKWMGVLRYHIPRGLKPRFRCHVTFKIELSKAGHTGMKVQVCFVHFSSSNGKLIITFSWDDLTPKKGIPRFYSFCSWSLERQPWIVQSHERGYRPWTDFEYYR